ncbi:MAG: hypothetical protein DMD67_10695 [Gemmatimonadetes bacterium]|nr:MAG: hypothetical protein DMD67_10695 [Gemmatimonadota bacterium]
MEDVRELKELQIDALREVANIGAGHAATALSQLTNRRIMISVPQINIARLEEVPDLLGNPQDVVAAVLMHMLGDLTGSCAGRSERRRGSMRSSSRASRRPATFSRAPT